MSNENTIVSAEDLAEELSNGFIDEVDVENFESTQQPTGKGMEFTVRMDGYTLHDFEEIVIRTAAESLLKKTIGNRENGFSVVKDEIANTLTATLKKSVSDQIAQIAADTLSAPISPIIGKSAGTPMTVSDYIAMIGRDYLTQKVKSDGSPATSYYENGEPRINQIVGSVLQSSFKKDLKAAVDNMVKDVRAEMTAKFEAFVEEERKRIATSLGYEIEKKR